MLKTFSEAGRLAGLVAAGTPQLVCSRFDWFGGMVPSVVRNERMRTALRFASYVCVLLIINGKVQWLAALCSCGVVVSGAAGMLLLVE